MRNVSGPQVVTEEPEGDGVVDAVRGDQLGEAPARNELAPGDLSVVASDVALRCVLRCVRK